VLGVASGSVRVRLGGDSGKTVVLRAGDVVVVPAGVAHKSEGASPDLVVVGAYPQGQSPDMRSPGASDHELAVAGSPRFRCRIAIQSVACTDCCSTAGAAPKAAEDTSGTGQCFHWRQRPV
jgi:uncharacterized protein YjlB